MAARSASSQVRIIEVGTDGPPTPRGFLDARRPSTRRPFEHPEWQTALMRIPAKVDYALRAMVEMVDASAPLKAEELAAAQDLPLTYLLGILRDLRRHRLVQSQRGPDGGFSLARPAEEISLADAFRAIDGPLAELPDGSLRTVSYRGPAKDLNRVWMAMRASLRRVLEQVSLAELAAGRLPRHVELLAQEYEKEVNAEHSRDPRRSRVASPPAARKSLPQSRRSG